MTPTPVSGRAGSRAHPPTRRPARSRTPRCGGRPSRAAGTSSAGPRSRRSPSPASSTAWWCSTPPDDVIRPAKLWNDTESAPDAGWLIEQLPAGATAWAEACGSVPVASFTITKLSWLHRSEPEHWARLGPRAAAPRLAHVAADRSPHHRPWRRVGYRLLVAGRGRLPLGPAARSSMASATGPGRARGARAATRRGVARRDRRAGDGRQHGGGARPRASARATWRCRSGRRAPCTRSASSRPPTRPGRSPASPTRPAGTCRSSAR